MNNRQVKGESKGSKGVRKKKEKFFDTAKIAWEFRTFRKGYYTPENDKLMRQIWTLKYRQIIKVAKT